MLIIGLIMLEAILVVVLATHHAKRTNHNSD